LATDLGDNATREILAGILKDEDGHVNEIEENWTKSNRWGSAIPCDSGW